MVKTAGLENRYAGNGIEGSNPSLSARAPTSARTQIGARADDALGQYLSVMLSIPAWLLAQFSTTGTGVCLTGVCGLVQPWRPVPSGIFFVAIGLVAVGIIGLKRRTAP